MRVEGLPTLGAIVEAKRVGLYVTSILETGIGTRIGANCDLAAARDAEKRVFCKEAIPAVCPFGGSCGVDGRSVSAREYESAVVWARRELFSDNSSTEPEEAEDSSQTRLPTVPTNLSR